MRPLRHRNTARHATGLARALSKLGVCSRSQGWELIAAGHVTVNGVARRDPEWRVDLARDHFEVNGKAVRRPVQVYLMLNKPRGLVTTASDQQGRPTVYECLADANLPFVAPVGRLDKASEGLLLFTNDTAWAAQITDPESHLEKVYHVQLDRVADDSLADRLMQGLRSEGEFLSAKQAGVLRQGKSTSWLEIVLDEGKNRHIRRLLAALGVTVLRLIRVAIGELPLGNLPKGKFRRLTEPEVRALKHASRD